MAPKNSLVYMLVAPCVPLPKGGHEVYTYHADEVTDSTVGVGSVVRVSFGKRKILGVVLQVGVRRPRYPTKPLSTVLPIILTSHQIVFARWIATIAHGGIGFTLRLFIPYSL